MWNCFCRAGQGGGEGAVSRSGSFHGGTAASAGAVGGVEMILAPELQ